MPKDLKDIKKASSSGKIRLKKKRTKKTLKKAKPSIYKNETPIIEMKDLKDGQQEDFLYVKGQKYDKPRQFGNLIKIGLLGFLILLLINFLNVYGIGRNIQSDVTDVTFQGYNHLIDAGKSATQIQFNEAIKAFDSAEESFLTAQERLWFINEDNTFYSTDSDVKLAVDALLIGGKHFAEAGKHFLEAVEYYNKIPLYFVSANSEKDSSDEYKPKPSITDALKQGLEKTELAISEITQAAEKFQNINEQKLPADLQVKIALAKEKISEISDTLTQIETHFPALLKLLGDRYPHRYLILLQNNNEIRPTGGFIGSYAIVDVNDGYIEKLETYDVYDLDGSYGEIIEPPEELKAFTNNWRFRDSNYSPDFEVSAKKARWFLEKQGGPTVDTVIAINQGLLTDMLEITGPVQVGAFGTLDSENYNLLLSYIIEGKVWGAEDPKHILKVFIPAFKKAILKEENLGKVSSKLYKAILQKHILVYSSDDDVQALIENLGLSGKVNPPKEHEDYLSVINIATGGTKSEQFMKEEIHHSTSITETGEVINEVKILRTHQWSDSIYYRWSSILKSYGFTKMPDELIDIMGRGANKVSTRIYVPEGSKLIDSKYQEVETKYDSDLKLSYFFTKTITDPGETSKVWIKYKLPYRLDLSALDSYRLTIEKQPGSRGSLFTKSLLLASGIEAISVYPDEVTKNSQGTYVYASNLVYDRYFSGLFQME